MPISKGAVKIKCDCVYKSALQSAKSYAMKGLPRLLVLSLVVEGRQAPFIRTAFPNIVCPSSVTNSAQLEGVTM